MVYRDHLRPCGRCCAAILAWLLSLVALPAIGPARPTPDGKVIVILSAGLDELPDHRLAELAAHPPQAPPAVLMAAASSFNQPEPTALTAIVLVWSEAYRGGRIYWAIYVGTPDPVNRWDPTGLYWFEKDGKFYWFPDDKGKEIPGYTYHGDTLTLPIKSTMNIEKRYKFLSYEQLLKNRDKHGEDYRFVDPSTDLHSLERGMSAELIAKTSGDGSKVDLAYRISREPSEESRLLWNQFTTDHGLAGSRKYQRHHFGKSGPPKSSGSRGVNLGDPDEPKWNYADFLYWLNEGEFVSLINANTDSLTMTGSDNSDWGSAGLYNGVYTNKFSDSSQDAKTINNSKRALRHTGVTSDIGVSIDKEGGSGVIKANIYNKYIQYSFARPHVMFDMKITRGSDGYSIVVDNVQHYVSLPLLVSVEHKPQHVSYPVYQGAYGEELWRAMSELNPAPRFDSDLIIEWLKDPNNRSSVPKSLGLEHYRQSP